MYNCIVMMGVSGSGKSSVGEALAKALNAKFIDGDDLHPRTNLQKMASGQPLNDQDREPWLERIRDVAYSLGYKNEQGIVVCSALKKRYRDLIREGNDGVTFLFLDGEFDLILERLQARSGHFMPVDLLKSQFATLEHPHVDEEVITVGIDGTFTEVVDRCCTALKPCPAAVNSEEARYA